MKWIIMIGLFIGGIFYLVNTDKQEQRASEMQLQAKTKAINEMVIELPDAPEKKGDLSLMDETVESMRNLLKDPNMNVRLSVIDVLWNVQDQAAVDAVQQILEKKYTYYYPNVLADTKIKIVNILDRNQTKLNLRLLSIALQDQNKEVRLAAVQCVGKYAVPDAITVLNPRLKDSDSKVRLAAVQAITAINDAAVKYKQDKIEEIKKQFPVKKPFAKRIAPAELLGIDN